MKTKINLDTWYRKDHFNFFNSFEEPFFGATANVEVTVAYQKAKEQGVSFFLYYLHCILVAANKIEAFKYRVENGEVFLYNQINCSATIGRADTTFGFSYIDYKADLNEFIAVAQQEIQRIQSTTGLELRPVFDVLHVSAIPWVNFTGLTHARSFSFKDSMPKISLGKIMDEGGKKTMAVSVTVHHGLMDGRQVGEFIDLFQQLLNQ
ncbi:chloramphenicol acetyltransferase [Mucilaginibacter phyllosphaerae]|uniref:Chloramphenicol O-acetyltransferase type A n=1 Tax=Mucilaginibacter phyllosphaerae TaxID=1812349 RepID=A0A4Y8A6P3_9SPHI|nr:chloramphenicol acetyltransferase [Mucilaginibacter phyllosphaerae]MBB3970978.1 chloramphenicol O-acetyltransferase type A [Mucilaginibacter phyllosphaerae]TEW64090.1 chloramphenicol acetyltransferase [Mucilaginibacter phyllosphaerae]GGH05845.1 chloramphenicol acetyltransferase [Mucilaginibacter phyllosphaerae]